MEGMGVAHKHQKLLQVVMSARRTAVAVRPPQALHRPPPAALRFAYAGAAAHESAVLHGLAAAYEGLFRLEPEYPVHGRAAYRHVQKPDKWIAFNGSSWMAQHEGALGSATGVLLLRDASCATPDLSAAIWKVTPSWKPEPGLQCVGMTAEEADVFEELSNPWGEAMQCNDEMGQLSAQLRGMGLPLEELAAMAAQPQPPFRSQSRQHSQQGAAALGGGGPRIVQLPKGVLYVGAVDTRGRPHGEGELLLRDGSVHAGNFAEGAAHGEGVYFDHDGSVHCGGWVTNFRVGDFGVLDGAGAVWDDVYDHFGRRGAHMRATDPAAAAACCLSCGARFHPQHNYKCRRHKGAWQPATTTRAARWSCCAAVGRDEPGCHVAMHAAG